MQGAMRQGNLGAQAMGGRMAQRPAAQFAAAQMANQARLGMKKGGETMKESKAMAKKEIAFMKKKLTSAKTANDPNSRINKSLRAWKC